MADDVPSESSSEADKPIDVFVSYRRTDDRNFVGRLHDQLVDAFGVEHVFRDIDSIPAGYNFSNKIRETLSSVDVVVALIGANWNVERLANEQDFVRRELAEALDRDVPIVPVLIEDTPLPAAASLPTDLRPLLDLNVARIRSDPDFRRDAARTIADISNLALSERQRRAGKAREREAAIADQLRREYEEAVAKAEATATEVRARAERLASEHAEQAAEIRRLEDELTSRRLAEEKARLLELASAQHVAEAEASTADDNVRRIKDALATEHAPHNPDTESRSIPIPAPPRPKASPELSHEGSRVDHVPASSDGADHSPVPFPATTAPTKAQRGAATSEDLEPIQSSSKSELRRRRMVIAGIAGLVAAVGVVIVILIASRNPTPADTPATHGAGETTTSASGDSAATTTAANGSATTVAAGGVGGSAGLSGLVDACKAETKVNLIALPDEWANYKGILQSFRDKYPGVDNSVADPNYSSQEELDAINNLRGRADMPDNIDVSPARARDAIIQGLWEPYKPTMWDEIPDGLKDSDNNWVAAYYGIMAIETNTTIVKSAPRTFADLKKPEYKGKVALNGDPRQSGSAFAAVMAASMANGGNPDDIMPGIQFFADLKKAGNLILVEVTLRTMISGETPIAIDWSYNLPSLAKKLADAGLTEETSFPTDAVYGSYYAQGVVKGSPHQNCAKLWIEHLLSDEGALGYLEGGALPARYEALVNANKIPADAMKNLPPADLIAKVKFLTQDQLDKANAALRTNWGPMVADV